MSRHSLEETVKRLLPDIDKQKNIILHAAQEHHWSPNNTILELVATDLLTREGMIYLVQETRGLRLYKTTEKGNKYLTER